MNTRGRFSVVGLLFFTAATLGAQLPPFALQLGGTNQMGWRSVLATELCTNCDRGFFIYHLEASTNMVDWEETARLHGPVFPYFDPKTARPSNRFYRSTHEQLLRSHDWKNQIIYKRELGDGSYDPFVYSAAYVDDLGFIKFAIPLSDPTRVFFQSPIYPLHYDFVTARLPGFIGISRTAFDQIALHTNGQQVLIGTLLLPADLEYPHLETTFEYGIQFVANDPLPPAAVLDWFRLVTSTVASPVPLVAYYVPSPLQAASAQSAAAFFASNGIPITGVERWLRSDVIYSPGWALGKLVFVPGAGITAAYVNGQLRPEDILVTDTVPAEVPYVAGIICLNPATPSSHVAILSLANKVPFAYILEEPLRSRVMEMLGRKVIFSTAAPVEFGTALARADLIDVDGQLAPSFEQQLLAYKQPPQVNVRAMEHFGAFSASVTNLVPAHARFFGGKAANFGLLRRVIPSNSPNAIAFSMDLWDAFLDQVLPGGATLRGEISNRLATVPYSSTNLIALQTVLNGIRSLIRSTAAFNATQQLAILEAVSIFPTNQNIRFRSSSNAEDSESFTAAGLLDSYSGCSADDTDDDGVGPSRCDPTEDNERGVFRAIQRVYSSFYNDNAYIERVRHRIDETKVGVGVLVHQSFPDPSEVANGVATVKVTMETGRTNTTIEMVTQPGAASVTNPSDDAQAEVVRTSVTSIPGVYYYSFDWFAAHSSLLPVGVNTMETNDYAFFSRMFYELAVGYHDLFPAKPEFTLDFEYKKLTNGSRLIKQIREIPRDVVTNVPPHLISNPIELSVREGENTGATLNHELKLRGVFRTKNVQLTPAALGQHFFTGMDFLYYSNGTVKTFVATDEDLSNIVHVVSGDTITDTISASATHPAFVFQTLLLPTVQANVNPVITLTTRAFARLESADSAQSVLLAATPVVKTNSSLQVRDFSGEVWVGDVTNFQARVTTRFYWPDNNAIVASGYTGFMVRFLETTITGFTTTPIVMTNDFAQTYGTDHHNRHEEFLFEPMVDAGVTPQQRAELEAIGAKTFKLDVQNPDRAHPLSERTIGLTVIGPFGD